MASDVRNNVKIFVPLQARDLGFEQEEIWAFDCGSDEYEVDSVPFFAYNISIGDIVLAPKDDISKKPTFQRVVQKSGNNTIRLLFDLSQTPLNEISAMLSQLREYGCGYEGYNDSYYSINIPASVTYGIILNFLREKNVDFEECSITGGI